VVAYQDEDNSNYGTAVIGDVSDNIITFSPEEYEFNSAATSGISVTALSSDKFVVAYSDWGNSQYGTARVGDVSSNSITFGSEYVFYSYTTFGISVVALKSDQFVVAFGVHTGIAVVGGVADNIITFSSEFVFNPTHIHEISVTALSSTKFVVTYEKGRYLIEPLNGKAIVGDVSTCPPGSQIVGIAKESKTSGETVPVIIEGFSEVHSGLTPGKIYYLDDLGTLTTDLTPRRIGPAIYDYLWGWSNYSLPWNRPQCRLRDSLY